MVIDSIPILISRLFQSSKVKLYKSNNKNDLKSILNTQ